MLNDDQQEQIVRHYAKYFHVKQKEMLYFPGQENKANKVDLFWVKPRKHYPFNTVATMGLSSNMMLGTTNQYVELIMIMPADWNPSVNEFEKTWQVEFLKKVVNGVLENGLKIEYGSIFIDEEDKPISKSCEMYAGLIVMPEVYKPKIFTLKKAEGKSVKFFALTTLTKSELDKALSKDIFDFIDDDLATPDGTDIFVYNNREPKKTAVEKHEEAKKEAVEDLGTKKKPIKNKKKK